MRVGKITKGRKSNLYINRGNMMNSFFFFSFLIDKKVNILKRATKRVNLNIHKIYTNRQVVTPKVKAIKQ